MVLLLLLAVIVSCNRASTTAISNVSQSTEIPCCSDSPDALQLVDAAGRTVRLERLPQRIVVVGRGVYMPVHLLYMFPQARQRLVGMEAKPDTAADFIPLVDPGYADKVELQSPGPEQIAALRPDLVLVKGTTADALSASLAQLKIPVFYLGMETPDLFFQDVANLGVLLGDEARAQEITTFYRQRLTTVRDGLAETARPRVLLVMHLNRGGEVAVQVPAASWMQTIEVQLAGGDPVWLEAATATDGWTVVNLEQIARWDPDKILVVVWNQPDPQAVVDSLKADLLWSALRAVQADELYAFPGDLYGWDMPDPRWILGVEWLAAHVHSQRFSNIDMKEEVYQYFGQLYGMDQATIDARVMPSVRLDVH